MYTWEELEQFVNNCRACPLCRTRKHPVMGRGDHKGKLMLVAEAPGSQEDLAGIPFVGPSGKVLDELLAAALYYQYSEMPPTGKPGSAGSGKRVLYSISEV